MNNPTTSNTSRSAMPEETCSRRALSMSLQFQYGVLSWEELLSLVIVCKHSILEVAKDAVRLSSSLRLIVLVHDLHAHF